MVVPYLPYFKLKEEPFNTTANPRFFFLSPIHGIALGKVEFTVDAKKGLTIVFGDTGSIVTYDYPSSTVPAEKIARYDYGHFYFNIEGERLGGSVNDEYCFHPV